MVFQFFLGSFHEQIKFFSIVVGICCAWLSECDILAGGNAPLSSIREFFFYNSWVLSVVLEHLVAR